MKNLWRLALFILVFVSAACAHRATTKNAVAEENELHELVVKRVVTDYSRGMPGTPIIVLANKENYQQILPIWVGISEGRAIDMALKKRTSARPGTHDLFASVLGQFEMKLIKVVITDLRESTYIAVMTVESHGEAKEIDARPSDAIALALRHVAPIFVSEEVIRKGGWVKLQEPEQDEAPEVEMEEENML